MILENIYNIFNIWITKFLSIINIKNTSYNHYQMSS